MKVDLESVMESWHRQSSIVANLAERVTEEDLALAPAEGEPDIAYHLCHINGVRRFWLGKAAAPFREQTENLFDPAGEIPCRDVVRIRTQLARSGQAVADGFRHFVERGSDDPSYAHPMHFLQHMLWHDGWHVGLIMLALRRGGKEPPEEWEEENIWGIWRTEVWP